MSVFVSAEQGAFLGIGEKSAFYKNGGVTDFVKQVNVFITLLYLPRVVGLKICDNGILNFLCKQRGGRGIG